MGDSIKNADVGATTSTCSCHDIREMVAIDIAGRDVDTAGKAWVVSKELEDYGAGATIEDANMRAAAWSGRCNKIQYAVAGEVRRGNANATAESGVVREERLP